MLREKLHLFEWQISKQDLEIIYKCLQNYKFENCRTQTRKWELEDEINMTLKNKDKTETQ